LTVFFAFVGVGSVAGSGTLIVVADETLELSCKVPGQAGEIAHNDLAMNLREPLFELT